VLVAGCAGRAAVRTARGASRRAQGGQRPDHQLPPPGPHPSRNGDEPHELGMVTKTTCPECGAPCPCCAGSASAQQPVSSTEG